MSSISAAYNAAKREAEQAGLRQVPIQAHAWATAWLASRGFSEPERPDIISGRRTRNEQKVLFRRWKSGDSSVKAKPAPDSYHLNGAALDVETNVRGWPFYRWIMVNWWGAKDGSEFGDPGHLSFPQHYPKPSPLWG